jgi:diguanylate cyclase (GGDEF)-like protein
MRPRLWLAMFGLVAVPTVAAILVTGTLLRGSAAVLPGELGVGLLVLVVAAILATLALLKYLLRPLGEMADSTSNLQVLYHQAREDSRRDGLTELGNHRAFLEELSHQMVAVEKGGGHFSLVLMDLDDLKVVNDRDGHVAGDGMLHRMAATMREMTRPSDLLFRVGGDEFAMLLPDTDVAAAETLTERLLHFAKRPSSGARPIPFSAGISGVPQFTRDPEMVYRQADAVLYRVKRHGRGSVEVFDPERDQLPDNPAEITRNAVQEVITGRLLAPVFQPIVDLRTGRVLGFEGLVRPDPSGPLPDTARLFAAAASAGRTVELDVACIEAVLGGAHAIGPDRLLALNLSPRTFEVRDFDAGWLLRSLYRHGISPGRVILEMTERDEIADPARLRQTFALLQQYGLRLAADDVGAANAGLRLLSQVQFDIVKIDLSLVQDGARRLGARAVLESLRDLALNQHAHVVAEGVETRAQLQVIRELDIGAGQGFLLGRPDTSVAATFVDVGLLGSAAIAPSHAGAVFMHAEEAGTRQPRPEVQTGPDLRSIVLSRPRLGGLFESTPEAA